MHARIGPGLSSWVFRGVVIEPDPDRYLFVATIEDDGSEPSDDVVPGASRTAVWTVAAIG